MMRGMGAKHVQTEKRGCDEGGEDGGNSLFPGSFLWRRGPCSERQMTPGETSPPEHGSTTSPHNNRHRGCKGMGGRSGEIKKT